MGDNQLKFVGVSRPRLDAYDKASGKARYVDDITYPDMWYGAVIRSEVPRGRIKNITFNSDFDWSEVVTADWRDIPGQNIVKQIKDDQPFLAKSEVNHVGEAILLVAAPKLELAKEARRHVKIDYEELRPVFTIGESWLRKEIIYGSDNIISRYEVNSGDVAAGFKGADLIVEGEYRTPFHEHAYLEPQGLIAIPRKDGGFTIEGSLQCPYYVLKAIIQMLGVALEKVNVRQITMGGAFGGKEEYPSLMGGYAVILAKKARRPVKLIYDREEDILYTTKRHPSIVRHKTGVAKDGTLVAMEIDVNLDGGTYATLSPVVLSRSLLHSFGPYRCPNVRAVATCWATNNVPTGAFRGFGVPQSMFAIESHMDVVADKLGISPLEIRRKNCFRLGDTTATGQVLKESVAVDKCLTSAVNKSGFSEKWNSFKNQPFDSLQGGRTRRGIGLALFMHGAGFTGSGEAVIKAKAGIRLEKGGRIAILTGCTDMGQGAHSVLPQIVADAMSVSGERVYCVTPDTAQVPDSGPTVASRTTMVIGKVLMNCSKKVKETLCQHGASIRGIDPAEVMIREDALWNAKERLIDFGTLVDSFIEKEKYYAVIDVYSLPPGIVWDDKNYRGDAYPAFAWACDVVEVEVDMETFEVRVKKMTHAYDIGKAVNPQMAEGQIEGGTLQALGFALMEDARYEGGKILNSKLQTYIIPTVLDSPEYEIEIIEDPFSWGPYGAKGLGELPMDGGAAAVANAICNAIGVRITGLPITPEKIFNALNPSPL